MSNPGEADPCDRPQKFMKGHYKSFIEQAMWRPIPAIGQNLPSSHVLLAFSTDLMSSNHDGR
jgi:hypothetical protein